MIVDLDGQLLAADQAKVSPFDAAYMYGDGLFDTLRSYRGFLYRLEDHLARLEREAELLQLAFDPSPLAWQTRIEALLDANDLLDLDARIRIQISRGGAPQIDPIGAAPEDVPPVVFVTARAVDSEVRRQQQEGVRLLTLQSNFARGNFPQIKSLNYLPSLMALRFARTAGYEEVCLLTREQKLLEGATSNIFLVRGDSLHTPAARLGLLPGITRRAVIELAGEIGLSVEERGGELRDLLIADEVFLTGSVREVVPVVGVDNSRIGEGSPGDWTRRLQQAYREDVARARRELESETY